MTTTPASLPFRRRSHDRLLGGVCGAVADRTNLDVGIVRVLTVVLRSSVAPRSPSTSPPGGSSPRRARAARRPRPPSR